MAKLTLLLVCGHEVERTLHGHRPAHMDGVHIPCPLCRRLQPVDRFEVGADDTATEEGS